MNPKPSILSVATLLVLYVLTPRAMAQCWFNAELYSSGNFDASGARSSAVLSGTAINSTNRGYLAFRLPRFAGRPESAGLTGLEFWTQSPLSTGTIRVREVLAPPAGVCDYVTNGLAVFRDLGDGQILGSQDFTNSGSMGPLSINLNSNALEAISQRNGDVLVVGLELVGAETDGTNRSFSVYSGDPKWLQVNFSATGAPSVLGFSPETVTVSTNGYAYLWSSPCGAAPLGVQWYRENVPVANATNSYLYVWATNAGSYWLVVTNPFGAVTSAVTRVVVSDAPPSFYTQPSPYNECVAGNAISLNASASGSAPLFYQWFFNGTPLPGQTSQFLSLADCRVDQSGFYWLEASNHAGTAISRVTQLTVQPLVVYLGGGEPVAGSTFYLASMVGSSSPSVSYQWRRNGINIPGATAPSLTFTNYSAVYDGAYDLVAVNIYGACTSIVMNLKAVASPPIIWQLSGETNIAAGKPLFLSAGFSGAEPLSLQWRFNGVDLPGETNDTLLISSASVEQTGLYTLLASNQFGGPVTTSLLCSVSGQAPGAFYLSGTWGYLGKPCVIHAESEYYQHEPSGSPVRYQWKHDGASLPGQTNSSLFLTNLSLTDSGTYQLSAFNAYGAAIGECSLSVWPRRALERWAWRAPLPQGNDLHNLAFGNGRYLASGDQGVLVWSTNGIDWVKPAFEASADSVRFFRGEFVLLPWYSADSRTGPLVAWVSPDAEHWSTRAFSNQELLLIKATVDNGVYTTGASYSRDGVHWRTGAPIYLRRMAFGNNRFVCLDAYGSPGPSLWTSPDGIVWYQQNTGMQTPLQALAFGKGLFVAAGEDGFLFTSPDGAVWTPRGRVVSRDINDIIFDGAQFIACGNRGLLLTSPDGLAWTVRAGELEDLFGVVFARDQFVAVGDQGTILASPDGSHWTPRFSGTSRDLHSIAYGNGLFVAVGRKGAILTSPDGITWTPRATSSSSYLERVTFANGRFVAVGNSPPAILSSSTGYSWQAADLTPLNMRPDARLNGVAGGNGTFITAGGYFLDPVLERHAVPELFTSLNGLGWARQVAPQFTNDGVILRNAVFAQGRFVIVGNEGLISWSTNGTSWSPPEGRYDNLRSITYSPAAGRLVAVGNNGEILSSRTQTQFNWASHHTEIAQNLHDIAYGQNKFVAVGNGGTIVESEAATPVFTPLSVSHPISFTLNGGMETQYTIQASTDLNSWNPSGVFTNAGAPWVFVNPLPSDQRFFRAMAP